MNQESTGSVHQNRVFCFKQRVIQLNQGDMCQQCPWSVYLGVWGFLHSGEIQRSVLPSGHLFRFWETS